LTEDPKEREGRDSKALKQGRATEAAQAMSEYIAEGNAERAKTARLRTLRLAKEAADKAAKQTTPTKKRKRPA
jgi:hypothetical protein